MKHLERPSVHRVEGSFIVRALPSGWRCGAGRSAGAGSPGDVRWSVPASPGRAVRPPSRPGRYSCILFRTYLESASDPQRAGRHNVLSYVNCGKVYLCTVTQLMSSFLSFVSSPHSWFLATFIYTIIGKFLMCTARVRLHAVSWVPDVRTHRGPGRLSGEFHHSRHYRTCFILALYIMTRPW